MWVFTKHGFFSAVCARQGDGRHGRPVNPERMMVRARVKGHLEALRERFPEVLGPCVVQDSGGTDYAFRIFVDKQAWSGLLSELAKETAYDNFKSEVERFQGRQGAAYVSSLHEVWSVMYGLQK